MNSSLITNQAEYDYRFLTYLVSEVFTKDTLAQSAVYQAGSPENHKFHTLDKLKFSFVESVFKNRTVNDKKRFQELSNHLNKRCKMVRQNFKKKK